MKRLTIVIFCVFLTCTLVSQNLWAQDPIKKADNIFEQAGYQNLQKFKEALPLYKEALKENPKSYEANWKTARCCREYAKYSKQNKVEGWEDICAKFGKKGMEYAKKAIKIEPEKLEGHFYYGLSVGNYSDGVGIITAVKEGLKEKTKKHLTKAYEINKNYHDATTTLALGRYWQVLPLWYDDPDKALELYKEANRLMPEDSKYRPELHVYMGKLMLDEGINEDKARKMLKKARNSDDPYFSERAQKILAEY